MVLDFRGSSPGYLYSLDFVVFVRTFFGLLARPMLDGRLNSFKSNDKYERSLGGLRKLGENSDFRDEPVSEWQQ